MKVRFLRSTSLRNFKNANDLKVGSVPFVVIGWYQGYGILFSLTLPSQVSFWVSNPGLALVKSLQILKTWVRYEYVKEPVPRDTIKGVAWEDWGLLTESHSVCPYKAWWKAEKDSGRRGRKALLGNWWSKMTGERLSR